MVKQESILLFNSIHPNFFEDDYIKNLLDEWIFDEMILPLDKFDPHKYNRTLDNGVSFGF